MVIETAAGNIFVDSVDVVIGSDEWTLAITSQVITESDGVKVSQGTGGTAVEGTLKTALAGATATTSVVVSVATGVVFAPGVEVVIGGTTVVLGNVNTATGKPAATVVLANIGTATNNINPEGCKLCPIGYIQERKEQGLCMKCARGTYQGTEGSTSCISCGINQFAIDEASNVCLNCPAGFIAELEGSSSCSRSSYWNSQNSTCWRNSYNQCRGFCSYRCCFC